MTSAINSFLYKIRIAQHIRMVDRHVLLTVGSRIAIIIFGFSSSIITARFLGPSGRGDYFLVVTFVMIVAQFGNLGLQSSNTYLVARDRALLGKLTANSLWVSLAIGGGSAALLIYVMKLFHFLPPDATNLLYFAVLLAPPMIFCMLGTNLLVGIGEIVVFNVFQIFSNLLVLILLLSAAVNGAGPAGFLTASVSGWVAVGAILLFMLKRQAGGGIAFNMAVFRSGFRYATKAYLACLLGYLVLRANVFILKQFSGSQEIGFFSVASQITDVLSILPTSSALVLFPDLVRDQTGSWEKTMKSLVSAGSIMLAACLAVGLLVTSFVKITFGSAFLPAVPILLWMLPGSFFFGLISIVSQYLAASGFPKILVGIWLVAFFVVSILSFLLIPVYAGIGAAIAISLTYFLIFIFIYRVARRLDFRAIPISIKQGE